MKGLILSGGSGTRLRPLTHTGPKQLIPVANKPVLFYGIENLVEAGITDMGIILGYNMPDKIKETVGDGSRFNANVTYIFQGEPKGLAHTILISEEYLDNEPFVMYLGDNILRSGVVKFTEGFEESRYDARILLARVKNPQQFGVAEVDEKGHVIKLIEKPKKPPSNLALVGIYLFKAPIFKAVKSIKPSWRDELEITDAIQWLIENGYKIDSHIVDGWWKDTGKPEDILEANHLILESLENCIEGEVDEKATIRGTVCIGKGTKIHKGCFIRGPVIIGENCRIEENAYIGPYSSIGNNVIIKGGEIESSIIMDDASIECKKRITDSLIGKNAKIRPSEKELPTSCRLVIGENSQLSI